MSTDASLTLIDLLLYSLAIVLQIHGVLIQRGGPAVDELGFPQILRALAQILLRLGVRVKLVYLGNDPYHLGEEEDEAGEFS